MLRWIIATTLSICFVIVSASAFACGIEGYAYHSDGSKVNNSARISTSWNGEKAFPKKGWYTLELGDYACGKTMTVYIDGNQGQRVTLPKSGNARVDFKLK